MVDEVRIALQNTTSPANTNGTWNAFLSTAVTDAALTNFDGSASAWLFSALNGLETRAGTAPSAGTGDAAWVDEQIIAAEGWNTAAGSGGAYRSVVVNVDEIDDTYSVKVFGYRGATDRETNIKVNSELDQQISANDMSEIAFFPEVSPDVNGDLTISMAEVNSSNFAYMNAIVVSRNVASTVTARKGATFDIETTLGTITTATLNSVDVFDHITGQVGTTVSFEGAATDEITTSGQYTLTLGDGAGTENITVQVNVVGLASFNINKDGTDQGSLTDVEFIILTGAAGSRAINDQITGITTTAGGDTGPIEITDTALNVDNTITVVQQSPAVGGGVVHASTLVLI